MKNRYYIMRHGESTANRKGLIVSEKEHALTSYGLTPMGAERVTDVAVKTRLGSDLLIISSDFLRARETSEIMQKVIDTTTPIEFRSELRERSFGDWHLSDDSYYELVWRNDLVAPTISSNNVETIGHVVKRGVRLINELENTYHDRKILLVGHGDVLQILFCHFNKIECRFHRTLPSLKNAEIRILNSEANARYRIA